MELTINGTKVSAVKVDLSTNGHILHVFVKEDPGLHQILVAALNQARQEAGGVMDKFELNEQGYSEIRILGGYSQEITDLARGLGCTVVQISE